MFGNLNNMNTIWINEFSGIKDEINEYFPELYKLEKMYFKDMKKSESLHNEHFN